MTLNDHNTLLWYVNRAVLAKR